MAKTKIKRKYKVFRLRDEYGRPQTAFDAIRRAVGVVINQLLLENQYSGLEGIYNSDPNFTDSDTDSARIAQQIYAERKGLA